MVDAPSSSVMLQSWAERDALAGWREQANVGDVFDRAAELRLVAHGHVEALLADQNLADGFAADGGFDGVLNVADVDAEAVGGGAIDIQVDVGLAAHLECAQIGDAGNLAHDALNLVGFFLQRLSGRGRTVSPPVRL